MPDRCECNLILIIRHHDCLILIWRQSSWTSLFSAIGTDAGVQLDTFNRTYVALRAAGMLSEEGLSEADLEPRIGNGKCRTAVNVSKFSPRC